MKYLITGGAGFIGSHLAEELLKRGEEVLIIDDLSTGSITNIEHLKSKKKFHYVIDTIMNKSLMAEIIDFSDIIFHLAAAVGVKLIIENPIRAIETNIKGTEIVLKLASKKNKKVILASSSEVYGKSNEIPFKEDNDLIIGPTYKSRWGYACSKAIDEFLAIAYWQKKSLPIAIVRLFNTVGPRQTGRYGMVLPTFVKQALNGEPITVYGDGRQSRSFTWIGDVVNIIIKLALNPKAIGKIFNIGSSQEITIKKLAELIKEMTGSKSEIIYIPYDKAYEEGFEDLRRRVPDISRIKELIDYKPSTNINKIIELVIEDFIKKK